METIKIAKAIKDVIRPYILKGEGRRKIHKAASGDITFEIDELAEEAVFQLFKDTPNVAYFSEDKGLVKRGRPKTLFIIDPIDGTRGARCRFECCTVSVASLPFGAALYMKDVEEACVMEIKEERSFFAKKGDGCQIIVEGRSYTPIFKDKEDMWKISFAFEFVARPAHHIVSVIGQLIDSCSLSEAVFAFSSSSFALTRILNGQLDAYIDVGARIYKDLPFTREDFKKAGLGSVIGIFSYDIAAAYLLMKEGGCPITDAYGESLDKIPLLDVSEENILSCIAASGPMLHEALLDFVERRMRELHGACTKSR
jgi:myo-inositol-1(or 4)-monophosphatase